MLKRNFCNHIKGAPYQWSFCSIKFFAKNSRDSNEMVDVIAPLTPTTLTQNDEMIFVPSIHIISIGKCINHTFRSHSWPEVPLSNLSMKLQAVVHKISSQDSLHFQSLAGCQLLLYHPPERWHWLQGPPGEIGWGEHGGTVQFQGNARNSQV